MPRSHPLAKQTTDHRRPRVATTAGQITTDRPAAPIAAKYNQLRARRSVGNSALLQSSAIRRLRRVRSLRRTGCAVARRVGPALRERAGKRHQAGAHRATSSCSIATLTVPAGVRVNTSAAILRGNVQRSGHQQGAGRVRLHDLAVRQDREKAIFFRCRRCRGDYSVHWDAHALLSLVSSTHGIHIPTRHLRAHRDGAVRSARVRAVIHRGRDTSPAGGRPSNLTSSNVDGEARDGTIASVGDVLRRTSTPLGAHDTGVRLVMGAPPAHRSRSTTSAIRTSQSLDESSSRHDCGRER